MPPYWETTVHAPAEMLDPHAFMIVDDLPSGSLFAFVMTAFVSYFFQFAGFVLTYLLHTTHAAKYGSRAGLGATLIQFGLVQYGGSFRNGMGGGSGGGGMGGDDAPEAGPTSLVEEIAAWNSSRAMHANGTMMGDQGQGFNSSDPDAYIDLDMQLAITSRDWIALILMTLGMSSFHSPPPSAAHLLTTHLPPHYPRLVPPALVLRRLLPREALGGVDPRGVDARDAAHARAARARRAGAPQHRARVRFWRARRGRGGRRYACTRRGGPLLSNPHARPSSSISAAA